MRCKRTTECVTQDEMTFRDNNQNPNVIISNNNLGSQQEGCRSSSDWASHHKDSNIKLVRSQIGHKSYLKHNRQPF